jgi:hypothetical protein
MTTPTQEAAAPLRPSPSDTNIRLVLGVSLLLIALGVTFVWRHATTPSDGARLEPGAAAWRTNSVVVTALREDPGGLRTGDVVVAVDGRSVEAWARALFAPSFARPRWQLGRAMSYTVVRDGRRLDLAITLGSYPLGMVLAKSWGTFLFAVVSLLVATFVFLRRPDDRAARVLFLWASSLFSAITWSFGLQVSDLVDAIGYWLYKATSYGAYMLFWVAGLHFALVFPHPHRLLVQRRWILRAIYLGLWNPLEMILGSVWWLGVGFFLRRVRPKLAIVSIVLSIFALLAVVGRIVSVEVIFATGVWGVLLLIPIWALCCGVDLLRRPVADVD